MKKAAFILFLIAIAGLLHSQTIENIRPVQDGDNINVTYRIGGSTEAQLFKIYFSVSMAGGERIEPKAVIGDVGENIRGGRSYYTIIWDVFEDVDEVIDPDFYIGIDVMEDASRKVDTDPVEKQQEVVKEPVQQEVVKEPVQQEDDIKDIQPGEPTFSIEEKQVDEFRRNGFFGYSGNLGMGIPIGLQFGSLNKWGYFVTPLRIGIDRYFNSFDGLYELDDVHIMAGAGATRHIVSGGSFYRLHGFAGVGGHLILDGPVNHDPQGHVYVETGVINVVGPFELTGGITILTGDYFPYSIGSKVKFVFGAGFAF